MRILAIDPGGTIGLAFLDGLTEELGLSELKTLQTTQYTYENESKFYQLLIELRPKIIVVEAFDRRIKRKVNDLAKDQIAIINLYAQLMGSSVTYPTAAQGKAFWTNDKLKLIGVYNVGKRHANDATRHFLTHLLANSMLSIEILNRLREPL